MKFKEAMDNYYKDKFPMWYERRQNLYEEFPHGHQAQVKFNEELERNYNAYCIKQKFTDDLIKHDGAIPIFRMKSFKSI